MTTTTIKPTFTQFESQHLNELGAELIELYKNSKKHLENAQKEYNKAIINRFNCGKLIYENHENILNECKTQRFFAEEIGETEAKVSNDLRGYKAALENGIENENQLLDYLRQRKISPTTRNWEKLPTLLNEPESHKEPDRKEKDVKRLEELYNEVDEIQQRNVNVKKIGEESQDVKKHIQYLGNTIINQDPLNKEWESKKYLEWIRNFGMDVLTGEAVSEDEVLEPHHFNPLTGEAGGGEGNKMADVFTIPVLSRTHREIHNGEYELNQLRIALIKTLTTFIMENYDS